MKIAIKGARIVFDSEGNAYLSMHFSKLFPTVLSFIALLTGHSFSVSGQSAYQRIVIPDAVSALAADADGDILVIGDPDASGGTGMAVVYDLKTNTRLRGLLPDNTGNGGDFGASVAIEEGYAVVGDPGYWSNPYSDQNGAVYVYDVNTGDLLHFLRLSGTGTIRDFGRDIAIDNGRVLISCSDMGNPEIKGFRGTAVLFDLHTGELLQEFNKVQSGSSFGSSVALKGNLAMVGAPSFRPYPADYSTVTGAVHVFDVKTGEEVQRIEGSLDQFETGFGNSLALESSRLIVGAGYYDGGSESSTRMENSGRIHLTDVPTGELQLTYYPPSPTDYLTFGDTVSIQGNSVLVGSHQAGVYGSSLDSWPAGRAFLFDTVTTALIMVLQPVEGQNGDLFGQSVILEDDRAIVTAREIHNDGGTSGLLYIYDLSDPDEDGIGYAAELAHGTDPADPDSDDDNLFDGPEVAYHLNPLEPDSVPMDLVNARLRSLSYQPDLLQLGPIQFREPIVFTKNGHLELQFQLLTSSDLIHFTPLEDPFVISVPVPNLDAMFYRLLVDGN